MCNLWGYARADVSCCIPLYPSGYARVDVSCCIPVYPSVSQRRTGRAMCEGVDTCIVMYPGRILMYFIVCVRYIQDTCRIHHDTMYLYRKPQDTRIRLRIHENTLKYSIFAGYTRIHRDTSGYSVERKPPHFGEKTPPDPGRPDRLHA